MSKERELAREIIVLTKADEVAKMVAKSSLDSFKNYFPGGKDGDLMNLIIDKIKVLYDSHQGRMNEIIAASYVTTFNEQELSGMVDFYKSPSGQALINKMPELYKRNSSEITSYNNHVIMPEVQALVLEVINQESTSQKESAEEEGE